MAITAKIVKVLGYDTLKKLNTIAVEANLNRSIHPDKIAILDKEHVFPISFSIPHSYNYDSDFMRCRVVLSDEHGDAAELDVPFDAYMNLPEVRIE